MENIILTISIGIINILCFFIGAVIGQRTSTGEKIETKEINPIKILEKNKEDRILKREKEKEEEYYKAIINNIDNYDGTSHNQQDIIRR